MNDEKREVTINEAMKAFYELQKRDRGCECCNGFAPSQEGAKIYVWGVSYCEIGDGSMHSVKPRFCPMCGKSLKERE